MRILTKNKLLKIVILTFFVLLCVSFNSSSKATYREGSNIKMSIGEKYTIQTSNNVVKWESSTSGIASVDSKGVITAVVANSNPVTITGTHSDGTTETYFVKVLAKPFDSDTYTLNQNKTSYIYYKAGYDKYSFSIEDQSIASISSSTGSSAYTQIITGKKPGTTNLIVTTETGVYKTKIIVKSTYYFSESEYNIERGSTKTLSLPKGFSNYEWSIDNTEVASLELYNSSSMESRNVIAKKPGTATITVMNEYKQIAKVKINVKATAFNLNYEELNVINGENQMLYITSNVYNLNECTYYFEDKSIATVDKTYSNYLYIKGIKNGDTTFYITNKYKETKKCKIHVYSIPTSITTSQSTYNVYLGSTVKINYTVSPSISNCKIRYVLPYNVTNNSSYTISQDGTLTPKKEGSYNLYLYAEDKYMGYCSIEIKKPKFSASSYNIYKNKSIKLSLSGKNSNTKWYTSNKSIATVDNYGNVKAIKAGTVTITADTNGYKATTKIIVSNPKISKSKLTVYQNKTTKLSIKGGTGKVKWKSSNSKIVKVSSSGKITSIKPGTAKIYATVSGITLKCKVTVKAPSLSNKSKTIVAKDTYALKIKGGTGKVKWKSSNSKIVKVSSSGKITGIKPGTATITATVNGTKLKCKVIVKANQKSYSVDTDSSSYYYGNPVCKLSKIYYSGNDVVADVWVINTRMFKASKFNYINITIRDNNYKIIAKKKFKNISLNIKPYDSRKITFKFTGNSVKNKKSILNNGVDFSYNYYYIYKI